MIDPVTCNLETPCLEKAFVTVSSKEKGHPIHQNVDHDQRKWKFNPENPDHVLPKILGTKFNEEEKDTDLFTFIKRHASSEVSFILERYLPKESADKLRERLIAADLLAVPVYDESEESETAEDASEEDTRIEPNGELTKPNNSSNDDVTDGAPNNLCRRRRRRRRDTLIRRLDHNPGSRPLNDTTLCTVAVLFFLLFFLPPQRTWTCR